MTAKDFERQFKTLYLPLGMYALRILGNSEDADDVVQEAFAKMWDDVAKGREIDNFKAFMYMVVRNGCISELRRRDASPLGCETIPDVTEENIDTSERDARLWRAIDELPEKCREVFLLSKRDGLSQEEIASEMDISVKTVKNQMTKAYARLREELSSGRKPFFLPFL